MRFINRGVTVLELMIALVIFSFLLGLSSQFIAVAVKKPFVSEGVEPWLSFVEDVNNALQEEPEFSELMTWGVHEDPFPSLDHPAGLNNWRLEWLGNNLEGVRSARFIANFNQHKTVEWIVFKTAP